MHQHNASNEAFNVMNSIKKFTWTFSYNQPTCSFKFFNIILCRFKVEKDNLNNFKVLSTRIEQ